MTRRMAEKQMHQARVRERPRKHTSLHDGRTDERTHKLGGLVERASLEIERDFGRDSRVRMNERRLVCLSLAFGCSSLVAKWANCSLWSLVCRFE